MIRQIVKDVDFLQIPSTIMTKEDSYLIQDLKDTLQHHYNRCVGLAANMIGVSKRAIIINDNGVARIMLNPEIIDKKESYQTTESCLSHEGERACTRYKKIKVRYENEVFQTRIKTFVDYSAQIIQHEIDHCNGIII